MTQEEELIERIQQMCDEDREKEVIEMIEALPEKEKTYEVMGLLARTLTNYTCLIRDGYTKSDESDEELDALNLRALEILTATAKEGHDDPNWWCRNGYTRKALKMEAEAIPYFEHVMTLIDDDPETQEFWSDVPDAIRDCQHVVEFLEHPTIQETPYIQRRSCMAIITEDKPERPDMEMLRKHITSVEGISNVEMECINNEQIKTIARFRATFRGEPVDGEIDILEDYFFNNMLFGCYASEKDIEKINEHNSGYMLDMQLGGRPMDALKMQMRIAKAMVPDMIALCDISSWQVFTKEWVETVTSMKADIKPCFAYGIRSEADEKGGDIWLYTLGLARFGLPGLEIMHSDENHKHCHGKIIQALADYMLSHQDKDFKHTRHINIPIARMSGDVPLCIKLLPWTEAMKDGRRDVITPGSLRCRQNRMNYDTCILFAYPDEETENGDSYQPLWMFDDFLTNDRSNETRILLSNEEIERDHDAAMELYEKMEQVALHCPETVSLKLDLCNEDGEHEMIWAKLKKYTDRENFEVEISETPYLLEYEKDDILSFVDEKENHIMNWRINIEEYSIIPDNIHILNVQPELKEKMGIN